VLLRLVTAVLLLVLSASAAQAALSVPPPPIRHVNDYAGALSPADRERLEQKLAARERESRNQVVVAIFRQLAGESLEDYSIRLAQAWRIGQKGLDNGVIFLVFVEDRKMRIEVGYGLEATLTDAISASIIRDVVAPRFREGRMADGIGAGLDAIDQAIAGTYGGGPASTAPRGLLPLIPWAIVIGVVVMVLATLVMGLKERADERRYGWTGGAKGWHSAKSRAGRRSGSVFWPWFGGGLGGGGFGGGGFGGGDSGGGGFGGGGGGFGGGGASGSW
jgi:uncharacterized protein